MFKFSVGFNGSIGFMNVLERYKNHIEDIHFVPPALASGRASGGRLGAHSYTLCLHQMLMRAKKLQISTNIVFNALCVGSDYGSNRQGEKIVSVMNIHTELYNIRSATLVSPIDAQLVKRQFPNVKVHASANMFIRNPVQAKEVAPFCDVLILDRNVNRDIDTIRAIKEKTGKEIQLVVNEGCVLECSNRVQHHNHLSHQQSVGATYYLPCIRRYEQDRATLLKAPIIRPEDLPHYDGLIDSMRLASRTTGDPRLDQMLQAYTIGQSNGNLFDIMESPGLDAYITMMRQRDAQDPHLDGGSIPRAFWERVTQCDKLCGDCTTCDEIAQTAFRLRPFQPAKAV